MSADVNQVNPRSSNATRALISAIAGWLGLILLLATIVYFAVTGNFDLPARVLLIAAFLALTAYVWLNPEAIAAIVTGKGTRNILTTVIMVALGIALVVAINWFYSLISARVAGEFGRLDLTAGQSLTLSPQSIEAVKKLPAGTVAYGFFSTADSAGAQAQQAADNLLQQYRRYNPDLKVQYIDPYANPLQATQYGLTKVNVVVFANGSRFQVAASTSETDFSQAILRLIGTGEKKTVAVLNIPSLLSFSSSASQNALAATVVSSGLANEDFTVLSPYNLVVSPTISVNDVTVLIVPPAPQSQPMSDEATRAVVNYLDNGGHVLLIGDPLAAPIPTAILSKYGITETRDVVVEQSQNNVFGSSPYNIVIYNYQGSTITTDMENIPTLFQAAEVIQPPTSTITGFTVSTVVASSASAYAAQIVTTTEGTTLQPDPNIATGAALPIMLSVQQDAPDGTTTTVTNTAQTRLVVVGDADFASDTLVNQTGVGNRDLFNNSMNWLALSEERISVRPTDSTDRTMFMTNEQKNLVAWTTIVFLPLLALVGGGIVWWRRR